ncbi:MAG: 30S ribosomal protein S7 [Candidatus Omnitrophota bacterium]
MRRRQAVKKEFLPDPKYNSKTVAKFINMVMTEGKKSIAEKIVYGAFDVLKGKTKEEDIISVFNKAIDNVRPRLEVKPRRVGGATYQIPIEVSQSRGFSLAMRWIRDIARYKKGKPMGQKLAEELLLAYKGEGSAVKKKEDTHKMADANKAFAHFKW